MRVLYEKYDIKIIPESEMDEVYLESVLGLKKEGDKAKAMRVSGQRLPNSWAYVKIEGEIMNKMNKDKLGLKWHLYWFFRNLLAFILLLIAMPFHVVWKIITVYFRILIFISDGSTYIDYPWNWEWGYWD